MAVRPLLASLLLLSAPVAGLVADVLDDDAGSGADAPDDPANASPVEPRALAGNLTPDETAPYDADWYEVQAGSGGGPLSCTQARFNTSSYARVHLREPDVEDATANATIEGEASLGLVGPDGSGALAGLEALGPPTRIPYDVDVDVFTASQAASTQPTRDPNGTFRVPGPCFGDEVGGDAGPDAWSFEANDTEVAVLTFGTERARVDRLELVRPDGTVAARLASGADVAVERVALDQNGTWEVQVRTPDAATHAEAAYLVGASVAADPEEEEEESRACRPHCMAFT